MVISTSHQNSPVLISIGSVRHFPSIQVSRLGQGEIPSSSMPSPLNWRILRKRSNIHVSQKFGVVSSEFIVEELFAMLGDRINMRVWQMGRKIFTPSLACIYGLLGVRGLSKVRISPRLSG